MSHTSSKLVATAEPWSLRRLCPDPRVVSHGLVIDKGGLEIANPIEYP